MKPFSPGQSLVLLLLLGFAISGWFYGIHWKRVATGAEFSENDKMIIKLHDQIRALDKANGDLSERISELEAAGTAREETEPEG